jgi:hypothetical protein
VTATFNPHIASKVNQPAEGNDCDADTRGAVPTSPVLKHKQHLPLDGISLPETSRYIWMGYCPFDYLTAHLTSWLA